MQQQNKVMSSDCQGVLLKLEDAIRAVTNEHGFSKHCQLKIEQIYSPNDVLSSAYKVSVHGQNEKIEFFVKCLQNERDNKFVEESRIFFQNEVVFYGELLVAFDELQQSKKNIQTSFRAAPKCYKSLSSPDLSYIIMENLNTKDYITLDETQSVNLQQANLVMEELGRLHALSFVMKDQQPLRFANITDKIQETLFADEMKLTFGRLFVHAIHDALKLARHSLPPGSIYVDRLSLFTLNVFDKMSLLVTGQKDDEQYKVVTHGDVRKSNMMFRYKNGDSEREEPIGVRLLDYQACRYSSPVHDLSFFLLVSLDKKTRDEHRDQLIRRYHRTLCTVIQDLGSDPLRLFPFAALRDQLALHTRFALGLALVGLPLYMDEGPERESARKCAVQEGTEQPDAAAVLHSAKEASARKSMRCKNKMMEVIMDVVDQGYL